MGTITITQYMIYTNQVSNIAHEAAISCKPVTHSFTGNRKYSSYP